MDAGDDGDAWLEEAEVMSEVHIGKDAGISSTVSVFSISPLAGLSLKGRQSAREENEQSHGLEGRATSDEEEDDHSVVRTDEQGDLVLPRRRKKYQTENAPMDAVVVHHHLKTRLPQVGLQIWRGALLLSDFILHTMCRSNVFDHVAALELGAGTGLAGLIMARVSPLVFITDRGAHILDNCTRNVIRNLTSLSKGEPTVRIRELDWQKPWPPDVFDQDDELDWQKPWPPDVFDQDDGLHLDELGPYQWTREDIMDVGKVSILLAADVVYSMDLTSAFFNILKRLMPPKSEKVLYLAMEKRYNFSLTDLDVVAHGYKHFRTFFTSDCPLDAKACWDSREGEQGIENNLDLRTSQHSFYGKRIDVDGIQQYIRNYDRGDDLELWEIRPWSDAGN